MEIEKKLIKYNFTPNANKPKYIVIHDTGNTSKGAGADNHYKYFNGGNRNASAHFFIDDKKILQVVEIKDSAWHCGKWYVSSPEVKDCTNNNSIGIEICVNQDCNIDVAIKKAQELVLYLMEMYNIPAERVITHRMCTGKNCPANIKWVMLEVKKEDEYIKAVNKLVEKGIISSPEIWKKKKYTQKNVESLIIKIASKI